MRTRTRRSSRCQSALEVKEILKSLADNATYYYGTGRRKNAVARVRLYPGEGTIMVNNKPPLQYFGRRMLEMVVVEPLKLTETSKRFNISAMVDGGGMSGQAGAVPHGIGRGRRVRAGLPGICLLGSALGVAPQPANRTRDHDDDGEQRHAGGDQESGHESDAISEEATREIGQRPDAPKERAEGRVHASLQVGGRQGLAEADLLNVHRGDRGGNDEVREKQPGDGGQKHRERNHGKADGRAAHAHLDRAAEAQRRDDPA